MPKRTKVSLTKRRLRSAISNGRFILRDIDHRGPEMRRLRDLISAHVSDLGGEDRASHSERVLVGRASMLTLLCEMQERKFALRRFEISRTDLGDYARLSNTLRRVMQTLGLQRRARDVTPTLEEYLRDRRTIEHDDDEVADAAAE